ncbi:MAG: alpha/beta hydrolase [Betaproteobacteria bacterium]|nr:alpha/beta hydrolase [Betaproteobacteria bacterium]
MTTTLKTKGIELFSRIPKRPTSRPPLLFIHGAFAAGWMWTDTFMPYFADAGYPCHALSLRGHGGSDGRQHMDWHSIADYVDDVAAVVADLDEPPVLIGHSMGGFVAQKFLERQPARATVLLCSVPPQGLVAAQFHLLFQKPHLFMDLNRIMGGDYAEVDTLREALFHGDVDKGMLAAWLTRMQPESHRAIWDMSMFNLPQLHAMNRPPMLILGAEHDVLVPAFLVQSTGHSYGQPAHIFRGMGHAVTHERGWTTVAAYIREWLDRLPD